MKCKCGATPRVLLKKLPEVIDGMGIQCDKKRAVSKCVVWCKNCGLEVSGPIKEHAGEAFLAACKTFEHYLVVRAEGVIDGN